MNLKRLLVPLLTAGILAGSAFASGAQIAGSGYNTYQGPYQSALGGYGGNYGFGGGYGYGGNFGATYGAPVLSFGYGSPGAVALGPNGMIGSYGAPGSYGYDNYGNYGTAPYADYQANPYMNYGTYPSNVYNVNGEAAAVNNPNRSAANNVLPRTSDMIQAERLSKNRIQLNWQGDARLVNQITFALLDKSYNPIKQTIIHDLPAQATFTKTKKAVYYGVFVQYLNGTDNTVISPL